MAKKNQNFETWQGNDEVLSFTIDTPDGNPVNIGGARIVWVVKKHPDALDSTALITKDSAEVGEIVITNPTAGEGKIYLSPADTKDLTPYKYYHEGKLAPLATGEFKTVFSGYMSLQPTAHWIHS